MSKILKMVRLALAPAICVVMGAAYGQIPAGGQGSAEWSVAARPVEGEAGVWELTFEAQITPLWHLYDLGPYTIPGLATSFDLGASRGVEPIGEPYEIGTPKHKHDDVFGFETGFYEGIGRFGLRVRATGAGAGAVAAGEVEYQICRDEVGCIRGVWDFSAALTGGAAPAAGGVLPATGAAADGAAEGGGTAAGAATSADPAATQGADDAAHGTVSAGAFSGGGSLWAMILEAILWGFAALLTPCVFPMMPMTVSFFMKDGAAGRAKALLFGLFIVALYTVPIAVVILIARFAGGEAVTADIFNWLATAWLPNVLFFLVFMAFAASLLGTFEMRMPSRLINRSDRGAERGGLVGVFFLALTLVLVSFSCTGPIVGTVLIKSTQGEFWAPIATMICFSAAFALPFTLLAFFPGLMNRLPQSGGWLNSVKVILGLVEIALGLKFLSVADQTYHWGILDREVYLAIWIVTFSLLGFYLLGKIRFRYDSPTEHVGVGRLALAIVTFSFVVYLVPGMWGAPLKGISGYLPPLSTQDFVLAGGGTQAALASQSSHTENVKYADVLHLPHGMSGYFDLEQGLAAAREAGKPAFIDFTGHGCVNCREMEARVWVDADVQRIFREQYVVISLYADDRTRLPEAEWLTTPAGKTLQTIGRKNSYIVNTRYGISSQPAYLVTDGEGTPLLPVYGYDLSIPRYVDFLRRGVEAYKKL
jgi:thiol:disulfide interchange protein DsbD